MQYILSETEYKELQNKDVNNIKKLEVTINNLCKIVAENKPTFKGWDGNEEAHPWGCIYGNHKRAIYCDECPVQNVCGLPKEWSK